MMKNNQRNAKTASCRKAFLRILSLTVTLLLAISMVIMPVSAVNPSTGTVRSDVATYRVTDAADATNSEGTATPYNSNDDSVWKFAVGSLGDTFKATSADFTAPTAEPLKGGTSLKLTWSAPEGADGKATVKVIADNYNKEIVVAGDTVTLNDVTLGNTYQVQVTVGGVSSQILSYSHIYAPTFVTNSSKKERYEIQSSSARKHDYMFVNVEDYADLITANSGILVKVTSEIKEDANVISYYDNHTNVKAQISCDAENAAMETMSMATGDVSIAFQTRFLLPTLDENGGYAVGDVATANAYATRKATCFDINGGKLIESSDTSKITSTASMKQQDFTEGYIFIPFDMVDSTSIQTIKENGSVNLNVQSHRYYAKNYYENNNTWSWNVLSWSEVDYKTDTTTGDISYWFDRTVSFDEVAFISDYDAFLAACLETTVYNEGKASQYKTGSFSYDGLYSASDNCQVYLDTVDTSTAHYYTLTNEFVSSKYVSYQAYKNGVFGQTSNLTYTTAGGEKMMLGFTAPQAGTYEISAPITSTVANGVHYRIVKEVSQGNKTIIQPEKTYAGEKQLTLMNTNLNLGDTVYIEAWADTPATEIKLGNPQFACITSQVSGASITYNSNAYITTSEANSGTASAWEFGYFINPFTLNGEIKEHTMNTSLDGAEVVHDMLNVKSLDVGDDATTLYNALTPYDEFRFDGTTNISGNLASKYFRYGYNATSGKLDTKNAVAGNDNTGTLYIYRTTSTNNWYLNYGWGVANGGGLKNCYYNPGAYQKFTAVADGEVSLNLAGTSTGGGKVLILHNNEVKNVYLGGKLPASTAPLTFTVKKGDTISVVFAAIDDKANGQYVDYEEVTTTDGETTTTVSAKKKVNLQKLIATLTPAATSESTVSFDGEIPVLMNEKYTNGTEIILPTTAKNGAIFTGWKADDEAGTVYDAGDKYTVNADVKFKAQYIYYGDLDGKDGAYHGTDISILRKIMMKVAETGGDANAEKTGDIDANGEIDIIDLVKMKKVAVGIDTTVGAK